jgi:hypothetical protein
VKNCFAIFTGALLAALALSFSGCPTEAEEEGINPPPVISLAGGKGELELALRDGEIKFFDFATGTEITDVTIKSRDWDLAIYATRQIYTNSGITAVEYRTGGRGAVWHTEKTVFDEVVLEDAVKDDPVYTLYNTDTLRYAEGMGGFDAQPERFMNVMTYAGYPNERDNPAMDGTTMSKMFRAFYLYDKRAFYEATVGRMPPDFRVTNRVYIIQHGDGEHWSKFQVTKFERDSTRHIDTYAVRWENF